MQPTEKPKLHPMLLLVGFVVLCSLSSYIIPAGVYERVTDPSIGREVIDPESFTYVLRSPVSPLMLFMSLTLGLQRASSIVFFLFIIGGMFSVLNSTSALNVGIANILKRLRGRELALIPALMLLFGLGASLLGNFEEFLVFVPLVLAICITVGYDSMTAVAIIFLAATAGYGGAITNAFTVGVAQEIAGLPKFSGMELRVALFLVLETVSILYVISYARLVRKNPKVSSTYESDRAYHAGKRLDLEHIPELSARQVLVCLVFLGGIAFAVWCIVRQGYYIDELSAVFLAIGILGGAVGGKRPSEICEAFEKGCRDMLLPGLMIGLANAAIVLLESAHVLDTLLHSMAAFLSRFPSGLLACGMFVMHELLNILVPSGSAQAGITMPLMAPLADRADITRQTAVLAFQLGDAFTNIMAPTGGEILAALAIARVPFSKWVRFLAPLFLLWWLIAFAFLVFATQSGYGA